MDQFRYTSYPQEVIFGAGSLEQLSEAVDRFGWGRLLLCSTGTLRRGGQTGALEAVLGSRLVCSFEQVLPHVPNFQVAQVVDLARAGEAQAIIGLGGGSSIGMAKAVSFALEEQDIGVQPSVISPLDRPRIPVIGIPTTYAGSEMTPVYGVTHHEGGLARKVTVTDPKITPALVLYDPLLTLGLSPAMTASTGINALAHCMEALYSITRNPISTAVALRGIRSIIRALPRCWENGRDAEARTEMLAGSMMAGTALAHVSMGLHHGLCHVIGGTLGVQHGIANAIVLPHALRFNLDTTAPLLSEAAEPMGIDGAGRSVEAISGDVIEAIEALIRRMKLPGRLRDVGVREADLPGLAELALQSRAVRSNPKPVSSAAEIQQILQAAW